MSGVLTNVFRRVAPAVRGSAVIQRASLSSKPAKDKVGVAETTIALGLFTLVILGPSGWVLTHLEEYKKKE